ncbi:MAG: hypothetical protein U5M51_02665 [Emticicia sp.]|nr:hypothetical protein [Emticicia sp.]
MKQLTLFFFSLIAFISCRKDFASFQKSPNLSYSQQKNVQNYDIPINLTEPTLMASAEETPIFLEQKELFSDKTPEKEVNQSLWNDDRRKRKNRRNVNQKQGTFIQKIFPNQTLQDKKTAKKRQKPVPLNSTIYTGFIILGIAILLALLSLGSLSLLFGVASILFLYIGFKAYFRKKRRRDIFR